MLNSFAARGEDILHKGTPLEKIDRYTYWGQITIMNSNKETEIKRMILLAWRHLIEKAKPVKYKMPVIKEKGLQSMHSSHYQLWSRSLELHQRLTFKMKTAQAYEQIKGIIWKHQK